LCYRRGNTVARTGPEADLALTESIMAGVQLAVVECQTQFRWERWPCPTTAFTNVPAAKLVTREDAFVQAIRAAGVTFTITRNCSRGHLADCSCAQDTPDTNQAWKRHGCFDDVRSALQMTKKLLDTREAGQDAQGLVSLHNNQAGRMGVNRATRKVCKCHGVSGSCAIQTCWLRLGAFTSVGRALKNQYRRAIKLKNSNTLAMTTNDAVAPPLDEGTAIPTVNPRRLVYLTPSPNYCQVNQTAGWTGTGGRECSKTQGEGVPREQRKSCRKLCRECGRQVMVTVTSITVSCNCQFRWCCEVMCDTCVKNLVSYTCSDTKRRS
ncbi:Wnt-8a-like, partial [Homarus americanus]